MEYLIIIILIVAFAGYYYRYKQRNVNDDDIKQDEAAYTCDKCNENDCDCTKE